MALLLVVLVAGGIIFALQCVLGYLKDRRDWNNGVCLKCHTSWKSFDMDSAGEVGYTCGTGRHTIWLSWQFPVRPYHKSKV